MDQTVGSLKHYKKTEREKRVLFGVIELYIATARPVGSQALKETGFEDLSSATIRNYFAKLENEGYLTQPHSSGGRVPTDLAFRLYAQQFVNSTDLDSALDKELQALQEEENRQILTYLHNAVAKLSQLTGYPLFWSSPRFDHDFIVNIKLVLIDQTRCIAVLLTNFGLIHTEQIEIGHKLSLISLKKLESYFEARLKNLPLAQELDEEEKKLAQYLYNEIALRYLVSYSNFTQEDIYRVGFSQLLAYPEFSQATALANGLAIFENTQALRQILQQTMQLQRTAFWIGDELQTFTPQSILCAIVAAPYRINTIAAGAIGVLGPIRMDYRFLLGMLNRFSHYISKVLTQNIYKFKIQFRHPKADALFLRSESEHLSYPTLLDH